MARIPVSKALDLWGFATGIWPWFIAIFGASAVTAAIAYVQQNLAWAIFLAAGVFCFGTMGMIFFREYIRSQNAANKLIVANVELSQRGAGATEGVAWFRPSIAFRNLAAYELYFEVLEFECKFGLSSSAMDKTEPLNGVIPPNDTGSMSFPGFQCKPSDMMEGRLLIKARFGRARDRLNDTLETTLRISCFPAGSIDFVGSIETLRNTLRIEHTSSA